MICLLIWAYLAWIPFHIDMHYPSIYFLSTPMSLMRVCQYLLFFSNSKATRKLHYPSRQHLLWLTGTRALPSWNRLAGNIKTCPLLASRSQVFGPIFVYLLELTLVYSQTVTVQIAEHNAYITNRKPTHFEKVSPSWKFSFLKRRQTQTQKLWKCTLQLLPLKLLTKEVP